MFVQLALLTSSGGSNSILAPVILFLLGALLFFLGFRTYRKYRILADTPLIPVRSVPMGLVHVSGKSTGDNLLTSPITKIPCYYYHVQIEREEPKGGDEGGTEWKTVGNDKAEVPFYLEDATGKILVNPQKAEYDVTRSFQGGLRPKALLSIGHAPRKVDESLGVPAPTDEQLRDYLSGQFSRAREVLKSSNVPGANVIDKVLGVAEKMQALGVSVGAGGISMDLGKRPYRLTEHVLVAGRGCNIMGTCGENPTPADEHDRNLIKKGENEKTFLITTKTEKQIEKSLRLQSFILIVLGGALIVGAFALALHMAHML
ncbi:MAG: E3 ubiquitin ligase family protein [Acidobacteriia bacterium]|nr:E3 ubiquitin ligase family protein [Terriglobia bacterium]